MAVVDSLFTQHGRHWQGNRYVYPVVSRRSRGLSIGINLNPDGACNFDCIYCSVDRTRPLPARDVDLEVVQSELDELLTLYTTGQLFNAPPFDTTPSELRSLNDVAFSGDGEPTSCPKLADAVHLVARALNAHALTETKIVLITNATLLHRSAVEETLQRLDESRGEIWAKLDAGTDAYYRTIERTSVPLSRVLDNILLTGRRRPIVIQSLFLNLHGQAPNETEIDAYVDRLRVLKAEGCQIKLVQVYTVARPPAEACVTPLSHQAVDAIAGKVRDAGFVVGAFYGPT